MIAKEKTHNNNAVKENDVLLNEEQEEMQNAETTIYEPQDALDALDNLASLAHKCQLNEAFDKSAAKCLGYMQQHYGFTKIQAVVIALIIDAGKAITTNAISNYLGLRNAQMLRYEKEILDLVKSRVLMRVKEREGRGIVMDAYNLRSDTKKAFCNNEPLTPKKISGLSATEFFETLNLIFKDHDDDLIDEEEFDNRLAEIQRENAGLAVCKKISEYALVSANVRILLYILNRYVCHNTNCVCTHELVELFESQIQGRSVRESLAEGWNELFEIGILELESENGLVDTDVVGLTHYGKEELLQGLGLRFNDGKKYLGLKSATDIKAKHLFYNERETEAVDELTRLLDDKHFKDVQARLESESMHKGFACLFYGGPGTGKTETVLQIARQTGRDIMQVDLSTIRDKYVGETEKRAKGIFESYRNAVKQCGKAPILLINEADAIICRRNSNSQHAVDKMENAMQNIILEEMEKLDGILIATTNLTDNMDTAFARRFLYKICFDRPSTKAKTAIWKSMVPRLSDDESAELAVHYDLSGGQIENIVRKQTVAYVLNGEYASLSKMHDYCKAELAGDYTQKKKIGFQA